MGEKKNTERKCLDLALAYTPLANKETKRVLSKLSGNVISEEEPDFIIDNLGKCIGVEHFLIDTLLNERLASRSRLKQYEIRKTYENYHENLEGNEEKAVSDIQSIIQEEVDSIQKFDYSHFIQEFERVTNSHLKKIVRYKEQHPELEKIVFLIEIAIARNSLVGLKIGKTDLLAQERIKGNNFPFTKDIYSVLRKVAATVDYTVICVIREDYMERPYIVYAFDNSNFEQSFGYQIKDMYFNFTYDWQTKPVKAKVKLDYKTEGGTSD